MRLILSEERRATAMRRLLVSPDDLIPCGARLSGSRVHQPGKPEHKRLFSEYIASLRDVAGAAARDWLDKMDAAVAELGSEEAARKELIMDSPAGPAQDMYFIGVVRTYWLACDAINVAFEETDWVDPPKFLLKWTTDVAGLELCVDVLASQPYWPIGLDENGNWC